MYGLGLIDKGVLQHPEHPCFLRPCCHAVCVLHMGRSSQGPNCSQVETSSFLNVLLWKVFTIAELFTYGNFPMYSEKCSQWLNCSCTETSARFPTYYCGKCSQWPKCSCMETSFLFPMYYCGMCSQQPKCSRMET